MNDLVLMGRRGDGFSRDGEQSSRRGRVPQQAFEVDMPWLAALATVLAAGMLLLMAWSLVAPVVMHILR